jgi:hypothetical protein
MTAYKSKSERLRNETFAEGGKTRMASPQAAGPVNPGTTGKPRNPALGKRAAAGGPKTPRDVSLAVPAPAGRTAPLKKGR